MRGAIGNRDSVIVQFQVPDALRVLRERAFWDIYYEHCSYFTLGALGRLFRQNGFEVLELYRTFDDQYAVIEARPTRLPAPPHAAEESLAEVHDAVNDFRQNIESLRHYWRQRLAAEATRQGELVVWGSGSKAVAFLSALPSPDGIRRVVDINPHKQGKYLAGIGNLIVPPEALQAPQPAWVLAMNSIYRQEISADLHRLGVAAELMVL